MIHYLKQLLYSKKVAPYIFISPFIVSCLVFYLYPVLSTINMSFQKLLPGDVTYVGLANYQRLWNSSDFFTSIWVTAQFTFWAIVVLIPLPLILAVFLNTKNLPGRNLFRSSLFIPILTSTIVGGVIFRFIFVESETSIANYIISIFGFEPLKWRTTPNTGMFMMVLLASWRWMGVNLVYFLAGLQNIPKELYESADIDGASAFAKFRFITIPMLKPVTIYVLTISIYGGFRMFEESYVYWQLAIPGNIGLTMFRYLYLKAFNEFDLGYGAAISMIILLMVITINFFQLYLTGTFKKV